MKVPKLSLRNLTFWAAVNRRGDDSSSDQKGMLSQKIDLKRGYNTMHRITRKQFFQLTAGIAAAAASNFSAAAGLSGPGIRLGVSLISYTGDYGMTTILEDCLADAASIGAEGIELLSEVDISDYTDP